MKSGRSADPFSMPDWTRMYAPRGRGSGYDGDPAELLRQMADAYSEAWAPVLETLTRYWGGSTAAPWMPGGGQSWPGASWMETGRRRGWGRGRHRRGCGCREGDCDGCHRDDCHCRCCVTDADLLIYARLGELRVVPLTIENPRRRERQVRLELSDWTTRGGSPAAVKGTILPPTEFTLASCSEREVVIAVQVAFRPDAEAKEQGAGEQPLNAGVGLAAMAERLATADRRDIRLPDVDDCEVYYADLRAEGCDIRPVRIAVAVVPRDCGAHPVDCGCGCCK